MKNQAKFDELTCCYVWSDETEVSAELVDEAHSLLDILSISVLRSNQRKQKENVNAKDFCDSRPGGTEAHR